MGIREPQSQLGRQVGQREAAEQQKFLADAGESQPATIKYIQPELVRWRTDGGPHYGTLSDIVTYYTSLRHGRLLLSRSA